MTYGRESTIMSRILQRFVDAIKSQENEMFDVTTILTKKQKDKFSKMQQAMALLFKGGNLADGLEQVVNEYELSEDEEMTFLLIMKLLETMIGSMPDGDGIPTIGNDMGMYQ